MKKTVAVIGTEGKMDPAIIKHLSSGNYRLLLFDEQKDSVKLLADELKSVNEAADINCAECPFDATWEADVILLNEFDEEEIRNKIKPVATQKPVINLTTTSHEELKTLLPDSKIIKLKKHNFSNEIKTILETF